MRLLKICIAAVCFCWLAGCSFQSSTILPDAGAAGDPLPGFSSDTPSRLESFDRQKNAFHYFATMTPEKLDGGLVRYKLVFDGDSKKLLLQAKKLSDNNYVVRYAELGDGVEPNVNDSALVFVTVADDTYYVLSSLADKVLFDKVFQGVQRPAIDNDVVRLETGAQADQVSNFFRDHRGEFISDQDYVRVRIMK